MDSRTKHTYLIVPKIDDADSDLVSSIVHRVNDVAGAVGWVNTTNPAKATILIAVGGDGTVMHAMRISQQTSAMVIVFNIGKVGFLAEFNPSEVETAIIQIAYGQYRRRLPQGHRIHG